jgi:hypothetical protein
MPIGVPTDRRSKHDLETPLQWRLRVLMIIKADIPVLSVLAYASYDSSIEISCQDYAAVFLR